MQQAIIGLLDGTVKRQSCSGCGELTTDELLEELRELGFIREDVPRKHALFTVRRACTSLLERSILEGEYMAHPDYPWANVLLWKLTARKAK
jgi:hypothetical protein